MLDLDGVIWLGDEPIEGSAAACARLHEAGAPTVFVTNMSALTLADQEAKLARHGIDAAGRVVTSSMAAATLCAPGERAVVLGGPGVVEALELRGVEVVPQSPADVVVVGMDTSLDYEGLARASLAVRSGARLLATNADPSYPTPRGLLPGAGALVAAVETAAGVRATVAGKPHEAVANLVRSRIGAVGVVVGDRADTDGAFSQAIGYDFALVLSGATTTADLPVAPEPRYVAADLASLVG